MSAADSTASLAFMPPAVPGWALPRGPVTSDVEAAFLAGAALNSLDNLVRAAPPWAGAWRQRMALKCAAAAVALAGRTEDEAQLRDAWHLRQPGADPGPAGNVLAAWKRLADRLPDIGPDALRSIVAVLGLRWSDDLADLVERFDGLARSSRPAPLVAAALVAEVQRLRPDAELLGWWLADLAIAARMRWPMAMPMLVTQARGLRSAVWEVAVACAREGRGSSAGFAWRSRWRRRKPADSPARLHHERPGSWPLRRSCGPRGQGNPASARRRRRIGDIADREPDALGRTSPVRQTDQP